MVSGNRPNDVAGKLVGGWASCLVMGKVAGFGS
jgi:hypothetical protein